jgi:non-heme chloroperoxidase
MRRRDFFSCVVSAAASVGVVAVAGHAAVTRVGSTEKPVAKHRPGPFIETSDGTSLFYGDWGSGRPVVFLAAWCLNSSAWDYQTNFLTSKGIRCVAYDRRGHGRSSRPGNGYDFDTLSDDVATVLEQLDLQDVTLVAHSMGAGEAVRYLTRHGSDRVRRLVLLAPITPFLLKTLDNPDGVDKAIFERGRTALSKDFPKVLWDNWPPFFVAETPHEMMAWAASLMLQCPLKVAIDCNRSFTETDFRPDLRRITTPTLIIQGTADVSAPIGITGHKTAKLIKGSQLKVYEGAPHGLIFTHMDRLNSDMLEFIQT